MKIYIGTDHAGFNKKEELKKYLSELGHEVVDKGAFEYDKDDDYPDFIALVAEGVVDAGPESDEEVRGVILGGSGQGEAIEANRLLGIRTIVYYGGNLEIVKLGREHNDANILSLGARFVDLLEAKDAVKLFLETPFSGEERHIRRIVKLDN
ncbi:MAG: ribose 5-phosphate isomerase [Patescibacteria group bacterium]|nr:ribose 5-phosphate isomerase [Patescibacteria group bacterium]